MLAMFLIFAKVGTLDYGVADAAAPLPVADGGHRDRAAALRGRDRQARADPAVRLAARRDGRPHPGLGAHPRGHDGHRGRVPDRAGRRCSSTRPTTRARSWPGSARSPRCSRQRSRSSQNDIKKVLAYSTVSQLGYMFLARRYRRVQRGDLPMIMHAFFKALLFLGAGSVIHGIMTSRTCAAWAACASTCRSRRHVHHRLARDRRRVPVRGLLVQGRDPGQGVVLSTTTRLWAVGLLAAVFTAFYMTRQVWLVFYDAERWEQSEHMAHAPSADTPDGHERKPHESPHDHGDTA